MEVMIAHTAGDSSYSSRVIRAIVSLGLVRTGLTIIDHDPEAKDVMATDDDALLKIIYGGAESLFDPFRLKTFRKLTALDFMDMKAEVNYSDIWNDHHYYNLTAPTVTFDRQQQRRKALAKQHFVKPVKKAKKREKTHVKVSWR